MRVHKKTRFLAETGHFKPLRGQTCITFGQSVSARRPPAGSMELTQNMTLNGDGVISAIPL